MLYAIILAGGAGTRFWPLSRRNAPKQFLNLCSDRPMLEQTVNRISSRIKKENIYIATSKDYREKIKSCLKQISVPAKNIFFEPSSINTFAPIAVLSNYIYNKDPEAVIIVLPSDHHIAEKAQFLAVLNKAITACKKGYILTFGIVPDRPETGYGYIKVSLKTKIRNPDAFKVDTLLEKPVMAIAKKLIKDKRYFWNSGMFIFKANVLLGEVKKYARRDYKIIKKIKDLRELHNFWEKLTSTSIDYRIMEKSRILALIPADFSWTDLGSWEALHCFANKDKSGNVLKGRCVDFGSKNIFAWSGDRLLATLGLNNIIIVDAGDAVLVCAKNRSQEIKKIVEHLKQKKLYNQI